jgi:hypothetical protein
MIELSPLKDADRAAIPASQAVQRLQRDALPRVRAAAVAWRNGLAGLLAGLLGFSLVKGRSDVSQLAWPWNVAVGVLLLAALMIGGYGATRLLWAAHGRPDLLDRRTLGKVRDPLSGLGSLWLHHLSGSDSGLFGRSLG